MSYADTDPRFVYPLGVSPRTVHRMIVAGELTPVIKLSGMRGAYILDAEQVRTIQRNRAA